MEMNRSTGMTFGTVLPVGDLVNTNMSIANDEGQPHTFCLKKWFRLLKRLKSLRGLFETGNCRVFLAKSSLSKGIPFEWRFAHDTKEVRLYV